MGLRATVIRKYEIEYGNAQGFNYDPDTLCNIITDFCEDYYTGEASCDVIWEIDKQQFKEMVDVLKNMPEEEFNARMTEDWFGGYEQTYSKKYVVELFENWLQETQADSNYVRISWL